METTMGMLRPGEEKLIGAFTGRDMAPEELYAFSVVLCDNDIDRDGERFSEGALQTLKELFVGVTGVMDHDPKSEGQRARIFYTEVQKLSGKTTSDGRPYHRLLARAYLPRTAENQSFINALESGIRKEVSVNCAVRKKICSVCGAAWGRCGHRVGQAYEGKVCSRVLCEPTDAYEWSFVAIPAQRAAGVVKAFRKERDRVEIQKRLQEGGAQSFSAEETEALAKAWRELEQKAAEGETYRVHLKGKISRAAAMVFPELRSEVLKSMVEVLPAEMMEEWCRVLEKKAGVSGGCRVQLSSGAAGKNEAYQKL